MAIAITLSGFNGLGLSVTSSFLLMKKSIAKSLNLLQNAPSNSVIF